MRLQLMLTVIFCGPHVSLTSSSSPGHCPHAVNEEIQRCVQPVANYAKVLNRSGNSSTSTDTFGQAFQLPKLGRNVFRELCRLIRDFEECVEDLEEKCSRHITINLIKASYGYLCNDGYETFMRSAECLMDLDQKPSVKRCHDNTLLSIDKINSERPIQMPMKLERMCEALNYFAGCVKNPIRHNCGEQAWRVIYRVLEDTTKTLMPSCEFTLRGTGNASSSLTHRPRIHATTSTTSTATQHSATIQPTLGKRTRLVPKGEFDQRTQGSSPSSSMEQMVAVVEEGEDGRSVRRFDRWNNPNSSLSAAHAFLLTRILVALSLSLLLCTTLCCTSFEMARM